MRRLPFQPDTGMRMTGNWRAMIRAWGPRFYGPTRAALIIAAVLTPSLACLAFNPPAQVPNPVHHHYNPIPCGLYLPRYC